MLYKTVQTDDAELSTPEPVILKLKININILRNKRAVAQILSNRTMSVL